MINSPKSIRQFGFTIIELLIATAVFSFVLIIFLTAFLRTGQLFYKGIYTSRVQEDARIVVQDISDDIEFYKSQPIIPASPANYFCVGIHRYTYYLGQQVDSSNHGIVRETVGADCPSPTKQPVGPQAEELLENGMQANKLTLGCPNGQCNLSLRVVYYGGDKSVLISPSNATPAWQAPDATCNGSAASPQYCAVAEYQSTILQSF